MSPFRAMYKPYFNAPRVGPHPAVDFGGAMGDPVLAAADGVVFAVSGLENHLCGHGVWVYHGPWRLYTQYCQLQEARVTPGTAVKRGDVIGLLGDSGEPQACRRVSGAPCPMLHFGVYDRFRRYADGDSLEGAHDPMALIVGCFDPAKTYPADRPALTYPLRCRR
ncbi:MAG: M23 family metallopeptidase [Candidatus Rokubacteria bacterium]|nr:M23 family metallopeptidase [Candidatus Rokubacteria bacterium]